MRILYTTIIFSLLLYGCAKKSEHENGLIFCNDDYLNHSRAILDSLLFHENLDAMVDMYDKHAVCLFGNMDEANGISNIRSMYEKMFADNDSIIIKSTVNEIMSEKAWAIERSAYTVSFKPIASPNKVYMSGRIVTSYQKVKNQWLIIWQISNQSPVPGLDSSNVSIEHKEI